MTHNRAILMLAGMLFLTWTMSAHAELITGQNIARVTISVTSGDDTAEQTWFFPPGLIVSGHNDWQLPAAAQLHANGKLLATVRELSLDIEADPAVKLSFNVEAGNADTDVTVTSTTVPFSAITNPLGYASAAVTLTGDEDGATLTGLLPGGKVYEARYNSTPVTWASLLGTIVADPDSSLTASSRQPNTGRSTINDTLDSISSQFSFRLSANDQASGTSRFDVIVPEPSAVALAITGAVCLLAGGWRRRRKPA
jgi:hypothetical protein